MLEKVSDRIYYLMNDDETDRPVLGLVKGVDCCLIVDSGNSPRHANEFRTQIEALGFPDIKYLILTHHHWDHTFGIKEWNTTTIANPNTYEYMKTYCDLKYDDVSLEEAKKNIIFKDFSVKCIKSEIEDRELFHPTNCNFIFNGELTINLGGVTCIIRQIPSPHTDDSTIVYIPEEKTLFLGDCIYGYTSQGYNYYNRELVYQMINSIEQYDVEYYLCSHESICTREEMVSFFNQLRMGAKITENSGNMNEAIIEFKKMYHTEPTEDDLFFIKSFGVGETWGRSGEFKPEIF